MVKFYGTLADFLTTMNPDAQGLLYGNIDRCFLADYPTLAEVRNAYGTSAAQMWLVPQLINLSEFCGCREKFTEDQLENCADIIAQTHYDLKVSELMLFFFRFKAGRYGRFYGSVDPMVITTALWQFRDERSRALSKYIAAQESARREANLSNPRNVTREEYWKLVQAQVAKYLDWQMTRRARGHVFMMKNEKM